MTLNAGGYTLQNFIFANDCNSVIDTASFLAQAPTKSYNPPKTAWGDPDLEGIFTNATVTPFERPAEFAGKSVFNGERNQSHADQPPREGETGTYNEFWDEPGAKAASTRRSSLIIDPPDGQIPPLTGMAQKLIAERTESRGERSFDAAEYRPLNERCIWRASTGPSMGVRTCHRTSDNTWGILAGTGRATRWSLRQRTLMIKRKWSSAVHPLVQSAALATKPASSSDSPAQPQDTVMYEFTIDDPVAYTKFSGIIGRNKL